MEESQSSGKPGFGTLPSAIGSGILVLGSRPNFSNTRGAVPNARDYASFFFFKYGNIVLIISADCT